jgi:hypothetical protein
VDLDDTVGGGAGALMKSVDVLSDQGAKPARPLEFDERLVRGVGLRLPRGMVEALAPRLAAYLGIVDIVVIRREPLRLRESVEIPAPVSTVTR